MYQLLEWGNLTYKKPSFEREHETRQKLACNALVFRATVIYSDSSIQSPRHARNLLSGI